MVDKTKSIKGASDIELSAILCRLRREQEVLRLIRELKLKSTPNPNGQYQAYSTSEPLSTETPVYNGKSIKEMTEKELSDFQNRLQAENECARIILDIQEMNKPSINGDGTYATDKPYAGLSLDTPVENLYHFGIPGMHWGVRRGESSSGKSKVSSDYSKELRSKNHKQMSNAEIKELSNRLQLERTLRELKSSDKQKGLDFVKTITAAGVTVASLYALTQSPFGKAVTESVKKGISVAATAGKSKWVL